MAGGKQKKSGKGTKFLHGPCNAREINSGHKVGARHGKVVAANQSGICSKNINGKCLKIRHFFYCKKGSNDAQEKPLYIYFSI